MYISTIRASIYLIYICNSKNNLMPKEILHSENTDQKRKSLLAMPNVVSTWEDIYKKKITYSPWMYFFFFAFATRTFREKMYVPFPTPFSISPITRQIDFQISIRNKIVGFVYSAVFMQFFRIDFYLICIKDFLNKIC